MTAAPLQQLEVFGPHRCDRLTIEEARAMCRRLALGRHENFTVLSSVVPLELRDAFAAVYAFCRWADDLGDETGDPQRSLELLAWWRHELHQCFAGEPRHPVMLALWPVIEQHALPIAPFEHLIRAFEQDQRVHRYTSWQDLLDYCQCSANPVGRLVLMIFGEPREPEIFARSDDICTALQLTNHWQDVRRDILERDRIYLPLEMVSPQLRPQFEHRLTASAKQGWGVDQAFLAEYRDTLKVCIERTWPLFERGAEVLEMVSGRARAVVWLLAAGGQHVLRQVELWNYETALRRPKLSRLTQLRLVARAWWMARALGRPHQPLGAGRAAT